jgi:hypothetical protein
MNYELLKRLKDSGFPLQRVAVEAGREIALTRPAVVFSLSASTADVGIYYVPSLSDLVEACGNYLKNVFRGDDGWRCNERDCVSKDGPPAETYGATLDDALAELWLSHGAAAVSEPASGLTL